ncbi:MAG: cation:proton antiporter, partial [Deltaproteobacteria bacterium]|nr:cation:proton antiporter [Deltaproteobacteria bacterium]
MLIGLLLLGGWMAGKLAERHRVPAITGYLFLGVIGGPEILDLVDKGMILRSETGKIPPLKFVSDLAIALIALTAGGEIRIDFLRSHFRKVSVILLVHMGFLMAAVGTAVWLARGSVPFLADLTPITVAVIAILCSVVMVAKSPAVTIAMINDYKAVGPLSQMTLVITVLKDLLLIVMFSIAMAVSKGLLGNSEISGEFLWIVGIQLLGSLTLGAILGLVMGLYVAVVRVHLPIFLSGWCLFVAIIGEHQFHIPGIEGHYVHLEPLIVALAAGLLLNNLWPERSRGLFRAVEITSLPVYCIFFALAAAKIDLGALTSLWYLSLGIAVVRLAATWAGIAYGVRLSGESGPWTKYLWLGMVSQAGVSLVLVTVISEAFSHTDWAAPLREVLIGAIFINQLFGPIMFRHGLLATGEGVSPSAKE